MLLLGGAGFIGSNLVDQLVVEGNEVHVIDNFSTGQRENCNKKAEYYEIDISIIDIAKLIGSDKIHLDSANEPFANLANISKAKDLINWEPTVRIENWLRNLKLH
jgi:dTDP-D-glucose 4,6-dehydratase